MYPGFTFHTEQIYTDTEVSVVSSSSVLGATMPPRTDVYILTITPSGLTLSPDPDETGTPPYIPIDLIDSGPVGDFGTWQLWHRSVTPGDPGGGATRYRWQVLGGAGVILLQLVQFDGCMATDWVIGTTVGGTINYLPTLTAPGPVFDHVATFSGRLETPGGPDLTWSSTTMRSLSPTLNYRDDAGGTYFETTNVDVRPNDLPHSTTLAGTSISSADAYTWGVSFDVAGSVGPRGGWSVGQVGAGAGW